MDSQLPVTRTVFPVKQFVSWYRAKQLDLRPPFQRLFLWKPKSRSYLVDTVMRGLPVPIVILRDKPGISLDPIREVVDGQQRLTTLISFICKEEFPVAQRFTIEKSHYPEFANLGFDALPDIAKAAILNYEISTHILPSSVDDQQVLRIFSRLNSTGAQLNKQELRNALYFGAFKTFTLDLSIQHLSYWRTWKLFSEDDFTRMKEVEYTAILILRIILGTMATSPAIITDAYTKYDEDFFEGEEVRERFSFIFSLIEEGIGSQFTDTVFNNTSWFYSLFGDIHDRIFGVPLKDKLVHINPKRLPAGYWSKLIKISSLLRSPNYKADDPLVSTTARTTNLNVRKARAKFLVDQLG